MIFRKILISIFLIMISLNSLAYEYSRPGGFDAFKDIPSTLGKAWDLSFNTKPITLYSWGAVFASTALLIYYDEEILAEFQRFGRRLGLGNDDHTKSLIHVGSIAIFRGPTDTGSWLYFLGDGWTHTFIGLGFIATGLINDSNRALSTGSQIFNGLFSSTIVNQIAKRSFGRESPYRSTTPRGRWKPFPSFSTYNNNISKYDAMPSGHVMTSTLTFTVIDENYPEQRYWLRPLAYTWVSLLSFQMVNNSVHWASDYPLGIMMGYVFGRAASAKPKKGESKSPLTVLPIFSPSEEEHVYGMTAYYSF